MLCEKRLSKKHSTIRVGFESIAMSVGAKSYGHQNSTSHNENHGGGIRRLCHSTRRHSSNRLPPAGLLKDKECFLNI